MPPKKDKKQQEAVQQQTEDEGRQKALEAAITDLTKRFGDGTVVRLGDAVHMAVDVIPTGSLGVDIAIGVGGIPRGRITEIYGPESSGKTTLCLHVVSEAQKRGGLCAFIDMEHALDPTYAARLGVNMDTLYVAQPDTGEQALEITETLVRSGALDVIIVDSVAALVPRAEIEGEMGDSHVGLQARLMSQALRKLSGAIKQSHVSVMFTNQLREKVGVMWGCFSGETRIMLADGTTEAIANIVKEKMDVEVLSYNEISEQFEPRRIVNWFNNGKTDEFLQLTLANGETLTCTPNHLLFTEDGYRHAWEFEVGDTLVVAVPATELALATVNVGISQNNVDTALIHQPLPVIITAIEVVEPALDSADRYDLEVEGNHCYIANGVVVHNSPETTTGGRALKFYASVRLDIRRVESLKQGDEVIGNRTKVRVTKNKVAAPFREAEFDIMFYENGISKLGEIIDLGITMNLIEKRGAFLRYNDGLLGQGRENAKQFLRENKAVADEIEDQIRAAYGLPSLMSLPGHLTTPPIPATPIEEEL